MFNTSIRSSCWPQVFGSKHLVTAHFSPADISHPTQWWLGNLPGHVCGLPWQQMTPWLWHCSHGSGLFNKPLISNDRRPRRSRCLLTNSCSVLEDLFFTPADMFFSDKRRSRGKQWRTEKLTDILRCILARVYCICQDAELFDPQRTFHIRSTLNQINHWSCTTPECIVISMLIFNKTIQLLNDGHCTSALILNKLMSAENWQRKHFGKLRLFKIKERIVSTQNMDNRKALHMSKEYCTVCLIVFLSSKAAGQCEQTKYKALHGLSHWYRTSCCTECWWVGVRATNCRKVKGEETGRVYPLGSWGKDT